MYIYKALTTFSDVVTKLSDIIVDKFKCILKFNYIQITVP